MEIQKDVIGNLSRKNKTKQNSIWTREWPRSRKGIYIPMQWQ